MVTVTGYKKFLGWAYQDNGQLDLAEVSFLAIINILESQYPDDVFNLIRAKIDLIHFYQETEQFEKAHQASLQTQSLAKNKHGENHRLVLEVEALMVWQLHLTGSAESYEKMQNLHQKHIKLLGEGDYQTQSLVDDLEQMKLAEKD